MMQNLKKNHFVVSKVTRISWIFIQALKILYFMTIKSDAKFEEKLTCFEKWHEEFSKFSQEHIKVSKLELLWDRFIQSTKYMSLKFTRELCVMEMKDDEKFEKELTCQFKIDMRILTQALKNKKNCTLVGCFWLKFIMFELKKVQKS